MNATRQLNLGGVAKLCWPARARSRGFTLLELLLVIAIVGILAALVLPAATFTKKVSQSASCEDNLRQLQLAWILYAHENGDRLVPNKSRTTIDLVQRSIAPSWVLGNAKWDFSLTNIEGGLLYQAVRSPTVYHCPADHSLTKDRTTALPRIRSYSLAVFMAGDVIGKGLQGNPQTEGRFKEKITAIPWPVRTLTFLDEHEDSIDDGLFGAYDPVHWTEPASVPEYKTWLELPSDRHRLGCNFSFADGHAEHWRWKWHKVFEQYDQPPINDLDKADLQKFQAHLGIR